MQQPQSDLDAAVQKIVNEEAQRVVRQSILMHVPTPTGSPAHSPVKAFQPPVEQVHVQNLQSARNPHQQHAVHAQNVAAQSMLQHNAPTPAPAPAPAPIPAPAPFTVYTAHGAQPMQPARTVDVGAGAGGPSSSTSHTSPAPASAPASASTAPVTASLKDGEGAQAGAGTEARTITTRSQAVQNTKWAYAENAKRERAALLLQNALYWKPLERQEYQLQWEEARAAQEAAEAAAQQKLTRRMSYMQQQEKLSKMHTYVREAHREPPPKPEPAFKVRRASVHLASPKKQLTGMYMCVCCTKATSSGPRARSVRHCSANQFVPHKILR